MKYLLALTLLLASTAFAQTEIGGYSNASALTGTERIPANQGATPATCCTINLTPAQIATYVAGSGLVTTPIASGTSPLGTSAIASGVCASTVTTTATGVATTDVVGWGFNGNPTAVTGYQASANGMLTIVAWPSSGNVNFAVCNNTANSVTPGAITLNWRVTR